MHAKQRFDTTICIDTIVLGRSEIQNVPLLNYNLTCFFSHPPSASPPIAAYFIHQSCRLNNPPSPPHSPAKVAPSARKAHGDKSLMPSRLPRIAASYVQQLFSWYVSSLLFIRRGMGTDERTGWRRGATDGVRRAFDTGESLDGGRGIERQGPRVRPILSASQCDSVTSSRRS